MFDDPAVRRAALRGALAFGATSLLVFATVAFAERWMYQNLGLWGAYAAWTLLFIGVGGASLRSLAPPARRAAFVPLFALAFFAYAIGWIASYFVLRGALGEWVGSVAGSLLMAPVFAYGLKTPGSFLRFFVLLFVFNSLGYFLGSAVNDALGGPTGMLLWGAFYGVFLGAGLGAMLQLAPRPANVWGAAG